jgi:hypothetical protein
LSWAKIRAALENIKVVTYRSENDAIVQTSNPARSAAEPMKKL